MWTRAAAAALSVVLPLAVAAGATGVAASATAATAATAVSPADHWQWQLPRGFPEPPVPMDNPMTSGKVALGRRLFFETRLSINNQYSCASCHNPALAYSDGRALALGATGSSLPHNAMALVNVAYNSSFGWDTPEVRSLEAQMRKPLFNTHPVEIGLAGREAQLLDQLRADPAYNAAFEREFPSQPPAVSIDNLIRAIAAFERSLIFGNSAFDRYVYAGEHDALSKDAKSGMALFYSGRLGCGGCHAGFNFTGSWNEQGRAAAAPAFACNGAGHERHRVPTLRNIALTAPYMHDGRYVTLEQVLEHYQRAGHQQTCREPRLRQFTLNATENNAMLSFLRSLTDLEIPKTP
jgi:cytochrome c peroxidase